MLEIVSTKQIVESSVVELEDMKYLSMDKIYLSQKGPAQYLLIFRGHAFVWITFTLGQADVEGYGSFEKAIRSMLDKNFRVYIISGKLELKHVLATSRF